MAIAYAAAAAVLVGLPAVECTEYFRANDRVFFVLTYVSGFCIFYTVLIAVFLVFCAAQFLLVVTCGIWSKVRGWRTRRRSTEKRNRWVAIVPCYNETLEEVRATWESLTQAGVDVVVVVVDGTGTATHRHVAQLTEGCHRSGHSGTYRCASNAHGLETNRYTAYEGTALGSEYLVITKVGMGDEPHRGNRGKKDSVCLCVDLIKDDRADHHVLLVDCDTQVDPWCLKVFDVILETEDVIGVCGETKVAQPRGLHVLQEAQRFEYWYCHILLKSLESAVYNVFVLSGCFAAYRLGCLVDVNPMFKTRCESTMREGTLQTRNILEVGEDRYLCTLLLRRFPSKRLVYTCATWCTTKVPTSVKGFLKQRRRWTNSLVHCHQYLVRHPPSQSAWNHVGMYFLLVVELWAVYALPMALFVGAFWFVLACIRLHVSAWFLSFLLACFLQSALVALVLGPANLPSWPFFFAATPLFSMVVPLYSLWNADDLEWAK